VTDALLVRAPVGVVYRTLTDLDGWPCWLDGCRSVRLAGDEARGAPHDRHALTLPHGRRGWRIAVVAHGWRHDAGLRWDVRGDVVLTAEWWLEGRTEGTVVHHLVHGAPEGRRAERRVLQHRRAVMHALQGMKDHLELAVAVAAGRVP
jgi:hypothetical protein